MLSDGDYYLHLKKLRVKDYEDRYEDITTKINKVIIFIYILLILIIKYRNIWGTTGPRHHW